MKSSIILAMVFTMMASFSSALPRSHFNTTNPYKPGGFTIQARKEKEVPSCAVPCIQNAIAKVTDCNFTDYACACKYHGKVTGAATGCVVGSCGLQRAIKIVVPAIRELCEKEAQKDVEEKEDKVERELEVIEEEDDEDEDEFDEDEDDEEKEEEKAKRQLIVPDMDDLFGIGDVDVNDYDDEEEEEKEE